ncbi:MAG: nuclear transport factor 2 family protein [Geobacter sp.]|nr:nuclear transport factor 2 family protein [Geobacter sp.]
MLKRISLMLLVIFVTVLPAFAGSIEDEIMALDKQWGEAAGKGDVTVLNKLLADNLYHVHATGRIEGKTEYIDSLESGLRRHDPITPMKVQVRIYGDTAVSTGKFRMVAYRKGMDKPMVNQINLYTHVWTRTKEGWKLTVHQATADTSAMPMNGQMKPGMMPGHQH